MGTLKQCICTTSKKIIKWAVVPKGQLHCLLWCGSARTSHLNQLRIHAKGKGKGMGATQDRSGGNSSSWHSHWPGKGEGETSRQTHRSLTKWSQRDRRIQPMQPPGPPPAHLLNAVEGKAKGKAKGKGKGKGEGEAKGKGEGEEKLRLHPLCPW